ncbi:MAG: MYXO-CTERM sorting domain-containing protein [Myxococcota bacterium]
MTDVRSAIAFVLTVLVPSGAAAAGALPEAGTTVPDSGADLPAGDRVVAAFTNVEELPGLRVLVDAMEVPSEATLIADPRAAADTHLLAVAPTTPPAPGSTLTVQWCASDCEGAGTFENLAGFNVVDAVADAPPAPTFDSLDTESVDVVEACDGAAAPLMRYRAGYSLAAAPASPYLLRLTVTADGMPVGEVQRVATADVGDLDLVSEAADEDAEICGTLEAVSLSGAAMSERVRTCIASGGTSTGAADDGADTTGAPMDTTGGAPEQAGGDDEGCGCRTRSGKGGAWALAILGLVFVRRR